MSLEKRTTAILASIIVNRPRNGYETVGNIKVASTGSLDQLEVANKLIKSQTKLHVYYKHGFGLHVYCKHGFGLHALFLFY